MFKKMTIGAGVLLASVSLNAPAIAADLPGVRTTAATMVAPAAQPLEQMHHKRGHNPPGHRMGRGNPHRAAYTRYPAYSPRSHYGERVYQDTRVWQGEDDRYYCRRSDGTTGLLVGGLVGGLLGRELAGGDDRLLGTVLGAIGGAVIGREIDRRQARCR